MSDILRYVDSNDQERLHTAMGQSAEKGVVSIAHAVEKIAHIDERQQRHRQRSQEKSEDLDEQYEDFKDQVRAVAEEQNPTKQAFMLKKVAEQNKMPMAIAEEVLAEVQQEKGLESEQSESIIPAYDENSSTQELEEARLMLLDKQSEAREAGDEAALNGIQSALGEVDELLGQSYKSPLREDDLDYDPEATYQELADTLGSDIPIEQDSNIAQALVDSGASKEFVNAVIASSPEINNIRQLQTEEEAERYVPLIVDDAYRQKFMKEHSQELTQDKARDRQMEL